MTRSRSWRLWRQFAAWCAPEWMRRSFLEDLDESITRERARRLREPSSAWIAGQTLGAIPSFIEMRIRGHRGPAERSQAAWSGLAADARWAWRHALRNRGVTAVAIGLLTVGIGATTAMFSVLDGVMLRPLPYGDPDRLVTIWQTFPHWRGNPALNAMWNRIALDYNEYRRVSALDADFSAVGAAYWRPGAQLLGHGDPVEVSVARGSPALLPMLGAQPALGRWFLPGEEGPLAPMIAVLSYELWLERFGADAGAIGRTVTLDGRTFVIVGILSPQFPFHSLSPLTVAADRTAIWIPIGSWPGDLQEHSQNYEIVARLRPAVTIERARQDAARVIRGDRSPAQHDAAILERKEAELGDATSPLLALAAAVAALFAIACGNLAALLLGESATRESEIRMRTALGAGAGRVVRQMLAESLVLALAGAVGGVLLATVLTRMLLTLAPAELPHAGQIAINPAALAAALASAVLAAIACGLAPALSLVRVSGGTAAGARSFTRRRSRLQHVLIAVQVALSMGLLVASGLLLHTLTVEGATRLGFATSRLLVAPVSRSVPRTDTGGPQPFYDAVVERVAGLPGVEWVTTTTNVPIEGSGGQWAINIDPTGLLGVASPSAQHDEVLPGFFERMGMQILAGRSLSKDDRAGAPLAAVVNETMARQFWPTETAVGRRFLAPNGGVREVVGIVSDIRERGLFRPPLATFYESVYQVASSRQALLVRSQSDLASVAAEIRRVIWSIDPTLPLGAAEPMGEIVRASLAPERYRAAVVGFFAIIALVMTAVGVGGVAMRAAVGQRRELCIRIAIGATPGRMVALQVRRYLTVALLGMAGGIATSIIAARLVRSYIVSASAVAPSIVLMAGLLGVVIVCAAWLPARRIRRVHLPRELARN